MFLITAKSSAYAAEFSLVLEVWKVYRLFPICSHHNSGSRKIINRYGLSVLPCMVPLYMRIGCVLPKYSPMQVVVECE